MYATETATHVSEKLCFALVIDFFGKKRGKKERNVYLCVWLFGISPLYERRVYLPPGSDSHMDELIAVINFRIHA